MLSRSLFWLGACNKSVNLVRNRSRQRGCSKNVRVCDGQWWGFVGSRRNRTMSDGPVTADNTRLFCATSVFIHMDILSLLRRIQVIRCSMQTGMHMRSANVKTELKWTSHLQWSFRSRWRAARSAEGYLRCSEYHLLAEIPKVDRRPLSVEYGFHGRGYIVGEKNPSTYC